MRSKIKSIGAVLLAAVSSYATTYINEDFESGTNGANPVCSSILPVIGVGISHVWVVSSTPIGTGMFRP